MDWQLGARQDADFSGIFVSEMAVVACMWAIESLQSLLVFNFCILVWFSWLFFKFATPQLALPPTEKIKTII